MRIKIFDRKMLALPYALFMVLFVVFPLLVILYYGFTDGSGHVSFDNLVNFFQSSKTVGTLLYSLFIAVIVTAVCLLIAYPVAYILAKGEYARKHAFLLVFVLPMWINFTLRITAMKEILNVLEGNLAYYPFFNTILCMVYDFLPFMIMPLFNSLTKLDNSLMEAGADLGANKWQTVFKVVIPLTIPGIVSGITMVFLPAMTNYVVLDMVYNSTYIMGSLIGSYFSSYDWNNGSLISAILLMFIGLFTIITDRLMATDETGRR
ncbi:MAG: ABC transporter permease [Lachnospiraceae bacterium]|nr:ABC transporter permease [Lachnospiraceae bacterium]